jgi:hypothetical protein
VHGLRVVLQVTQKSDWTEANGVKYAMLRKHYFANYLLNVILTHSSDGEYDEQKDSDSNGSQKSTSATLNITIVQRMIDMLIRQLHIVLSDMDIR